MLPMYQVRTGSVTPMHVPPDGCIRVALVKQVIGALPLDQPIRVVHPVGWGKEMVLGAMSVHRVLEMIRFRITGLILHRITRSLFDWELWGGSWGKSSPPAETSLREVQLQNRDDHAILERGAF